MAHVGQELTFGTAGTFSGYPGSISLLFGQFLLGNIEVDHANRLRLPVRTQERKKRKLVTTKLAWAVRGLSAQIEFKNGLTGREYLLVKRFQNVG